ncbi:MAG: Ig domain protein group 2 domain protein [Panacagrimonas sp.]|nr:Ig-like domain-containing protein [Panacagrimonas sp.]MCC2657850.1 Ig domain protein group 2 domain protein [Panacagrimonas sp.]
MKILKTLVLLAVGAASLTGCGDGGVQSPDFTAELLGLTLSTSDTDATPVAVDEGEPLQYTVAAGRRVTLDLVGRYTAPPGSDDETEDRAISGGDFTITPSDAGTVEEGEFRGSRPGQVTVTAERGGVESNAIIFNVTAAVIESIEIEPASASIPVGASQDFNAVGVYSDDERRPVLVNWTIDDPTVATLTNATNSSTVTATAAPGAVIGDAAVLTATRPASGGIPELTDTANITIDNRTVVGLVDGSAECTPSTIGIGFTSQCTVEVSYSDGSTEDAGTLVTWATDGPGDALVDVDSATGEVTGVAPGAATITATLTGGGSPSTASATVTVLSSANARCQQPLVAPDAIAGGVTSVLCVGCQIVNAGNAVDDDADTFASINTVLGLLSATATLTVNSTPNTNEITPSGPVGFVIAQPPGLLLSAEVLSTLTVSTINGSGAVIQSGGAVPQPSDPLPILPATVTLLGTIGGQDAALISFEPTTAFNGLALTFNAGLASVLPSINVFQACAVANPDVAP